jgi:hypothetical protein
MTRAGNARISFGLLLLASCVKRSVVMAPDGQNAYLIECQRARKDCLAEAADACPSGYRILDQEARTGAFVTSGQAGYAPQAWNTYKAEMLVRCDREDSAK